MAKFEEMQLDWSPETDPDLDATVLVEADGEPVQDLSYEEGIELARQENK